MFLIKTKDVLSRSKFMMDLTKQHFLFIYSKSKHMLLSLPCSYSVVLVVSYGHS